MIADLLSLQATPYLFLGLVAIYYLLPYLQVWRLRDIPSPGFAAFSNFWLLLQTRRGSRFLVVDDAHKRYGKLVRIAPRHVSIADDNAIQAVYGHGNGFLKAYVVFYIFLGDPTHASNTGTFTMPLFPSVAVCSTHATVRSTPASARPSRTPSV